MSDRGVATGTAATGTTDRLPPGAARILGRPTSGRRAKSPVSEEAIRIWCEAVDDWNPAYLDPQWAAMSAFGGIVAPATTLNMWTLHGNRRTFQGIEPLDEINEVLAGHGFTSVAAVNTKHRYRRPLRPGDRLHLVQTLVDVSPPRRTALGVGHFLTIAHDYLTDDDEPVGEVELTMLRWDPRTSPVGAAGGSPGTDPTGTDRTGTDPRGSNADVDVEPTRPRRREDTLRASQVRVGDRIGPWVIPMTAHRIVALAVATFDYNDVHLDRDAAHRRGAPDTILNVLGSAGLVNCLITDWAGPEARLTGLDLALLRPCHPGDVLTLTGAVVEAVDTRLRVDVTGAHLRGDHVRAVVGLELP